MQWSQRQELWLSPCKCHERMPEWLKPVYGRLESCLEAWGQGQLGQQIPCTTAGQTVVGCFHNDFHQDHSVFGDL